MTPAELAALHPRLYHLTHTSNLEGIRARGLLSAAALLASAALPEPERQRLGSERRAGPLPVQDRHGHLAIISDNAPLSVTALGKCLDAGLTPADWLRELNRRVFFWAGEARLRRLVQARNNRDQEKSVLVLDTRSVAEAHADAIELCAINSGATIRAAPRRGAATFTPLGRHDYRAWSALRGGRDTICEVAFTGPIPDVFDHVVEIRDAAAVTA